MRKIFFAFVALIACSLSLDAQDASSLYIPSDPARVGTAGIALGYDASAYAAEYNSSAIALSGQTFSFGASYGSWAPEASGSGVIGAGGFFRTGKIGIGLFGRRVADSREALLTNENSVVTGSFKPSDLVAGLGVSYALSEKLSLGAAVKFLSSSMAPGVKESSVCFDVNASYRLDALSVGAGVCNLPLSTQVRAGAAYSVSGLSPAVEITYNTDGGFGASAALEYGIADIVFLRGGYHFASGEAVPPSFASLGAGLKFAGVALDAAYILASDTIGGGFTAGLSYSF